MVVANLHSLQCADEIVLAEVWEFLRSGEGSNVYESLNPMFLKQLSELLEAAGGMANGEDLHLVQL